MKGTAVQTFFISVKQACEVLSLGKTSIYKLINSGDLHTKKVGRRTLVCTSSITAFAVDKYLTEGGE